VGFVSVSTTLTANAVTTRLKRKMLIPGPSIDCYRTDAYQV
jgi:hypothetical protein